MKVKQLFVIALISVLASCGFVEEEEAVESNREGALCVLSEEGCPADCLGVKAWSVRTPDNCVDDFSSTATETIACTGRPLSGEIVDNRVRSAYRRVEDGKLFFVDGDGVTVEPNLPAGEWEGTSIRPTLCTE